MKFINPKRPEKHPEEDYPETKCEKKEDGDIIGVL
jgi:hypothetical protein